MPAPRPILPTPSGLAELALAGSLASQSNSSQAMKIEPAGIQRFWLANRRLQHEWLREISLFRVNLADQVAQFERLSLEVLLTELVSRVWGTNWTIAEGRCENRDVARILLNVIHGMARIRREVLLLMIRNWNGPATEVISRLDRFRRRSERWTDMLIAGPASIHGVWDFAVEPDRARDFGVARQGGVALNPTSLLVSAGLRVMFASSWPPGCCEGPHFDDLLSAILATMPPDAFENAGV